MNSTLTKTTLDFNDGILSIQFVDNAVVDVEDVIYIFCYALEKANGRPYGVLFDSSTTHELTEEAINYFANSSYLDKVIAMAYISKDLISKIRLKLLLIFERPPIKLKMFDDEGDGYEWLRELVDNIETKY